MSFLYFTVATVSCLIGWLSRGRFFNPLTVFSSIWMSVVGLSYLQLSAWQSPIEDATYFVLFVMQTAFSIFYLLGNGIKLKEYKADTERLTVTPKQLYFLFRIWLIVEILEVVYSGGLPVIWHLFNTGKTYFDFGIPSVHGLMNSIGLVILLIAVFLILDGQDTNHKLLKIILFILAFYFALITRQVIVSALIEILIVIFLYKPKLVIHKILPILLISIVMFGIVGNLRTGYEAFMYVSLIKKEIPQWMVGFYWVYMYLSMTITNINNLITGGFPPVGMNALSGFIPSVFAPMLGIDTGFYSADYLVTGAFNVSGFFVYFYQGFSTAGVVFISAIYGFLGGILFRKYCEYPSERNMLLLAIIMQIIMLSFFDNMLLYLPSSFQLIVVLFLYRRDTHNVIKRASNSLTR